MQSLEYVTRCDLCGEVITIGNKTRKPMDTLKIRFNAKIAGQDITNTKDYGHVCAKCLTEIITPMIEKARKEPNVTVEILKQ